MAVKKELFDNPTCYNLEQNPILLSLNLFSFEQIENKYFLSHDTFLHWENEAKTGNPKALYLIAKCYEKGINLQKSFVNAFEYYKKAADAGHADSQFMTANYYYQGLGVNLSYIKAFDYYQMASYQGHEKAYNQLIKFYDGNFRADLSPEECISYLFEGAELGDAACIRKIGTYYEVGLGGLAKNKDLAFKYYNIAAEQNDSLSLYYIARCYMYGIGIKTSLESALNYYKLASDQGIAIAQAKLGNIFLFGERVLQDFNASFKYFQMAADHGHILAIRALAYFYHKGIAVDQSFLIAFKYYKNSAEEGDTLAIFQLGEMYRWGHGVKRSLNKALFYYKLAAADGEEEAICKLNYWQKEFKKARVGKHNSKSGQRKKLMHCLEEIIFNGKTPESELSLAYSFHEGIGIKKSLEKAFEYYKIAADLGHANAQFKTAICYYQGEGTGLSYETAVKYFQMAARQGHANAQFKLGVCYYEGIGIEISFKLAFKYFKLAADQGHANSQFNTAICYNYGRGIEKSEQMAFHYYQMAAEQENAEAQCRLGYCYKVGQGVEPDFSKSIYYFKLAADQKSKNALFYLGKFYEKGIGVEKSGKMAFQYYKRSADLGHPSGQFEIAKYFSKRDPRQAFNYYTKAAEQGHGKACYNLGNIYRTGQGVKKSLIKAIDYYKIALKTVLNEKIITELISSCEKELLIKIVKGILEEAAKIPNDEFGYFFNVDRLLENTTATSTEEVFEYCKKFAEDGNKNAFYPLALCYKLRIGTVKSIDNYFYWLNLAADVNDPRAQIILMFEKNDLQKIFIHSPSILFQELDSSCYNVAIFLYKKIILQEKPSQSDINSMVGYLQLAAEQEYLLALKLIGNFCERGIFLELSLEKAFNYYKIGAKQDFAFFWQDLFKISLEQELEQEALTYCQLALKSRLPDASFMRGLCYLYGIDLDFNSLEGWKLINKQAIKNNPKAFYFLGNYLENNEINKQKALKESLEFFGLNFQTNLILSKKALALYRKAAQLNYTPAVVKMGDYYALTNEHLNALNLYEKAAQQESAEAYYQLGRLYSKRDLSKSLNYFTRASLFGHPFHADQLPLDLAEEISQKEKIILPPNWLARRSVIEYTNPFGQIRKFKSLSLMKVETIEYDEIYLKNIFDIFRRIPIYVNLADPSQKEIEIVLDAMILNPNIVVICHKVDGSKFNRFPQLCFETFTDDLTKEEFLQISSKISHNC